MICTLSSRGVFCSLVHDIDITEFDVYQFHALEAWFQDRMAQHPEVTWRGKRYTPTGRWYTVCLFGSSFDFAFTLCEEFCNTWGAKFA